MGRGGEARQISQRRRCGVRSKIQKQKDSSLAFKVGIVISLPLLDLKYGVKFRQREE